jgi:3alpha(or 20beta)-hydroxysteroid dehydrogenase
MVDRVKGKVAIVTGGASGIGEAIVRLLREEGATVVIADKDAAAGASLAASLGAGAVFEAADVTRSDDWSRLVASIVARFGRIDVLVNNAGMGFVALVGDEPEEKHRATLDVNVTGVWHGIRAVLPRMIAQRGGSIVNISSIDGLVGVAGMTSYVASKFAVTGMTRSVALEVGRHDVRVNAVHPGYVATPMLARAPAELRGRIDEALARQPMARAGEPREIAQAVLFFASDESSFCTGSSLVVDGGHTAGPYREPLDGQV